MKLFNISSNIMQPGHPTTWNVNELRDFKVYKVHGESLPLAEARKLRRKLEKEDNKK